MKSKITLATIALIIGSGLAFAQDNNKMPRVRYEARLAFDVSSNTGVGQFYDTGAGFTAGGLAEIRLPQDFYFSPGLLLYYTGWSMDNSRLEALKLYSGSASNWGLRIPISVGYNIPLLTNLTMQVYSGPWLNVNLSARQTMSAAPESPYEDFYESNLFRDGFKRVDAQWGFGLKLAWDDHYIVGVSFGVGMTPVRHFTSMHNEMTQRRNSFQLNLGYRF